MEFDYKEDLIISSSTTTDQLDACNNPFLLRPSHDSTDASTEAQHNVMMMMMMKMILQQESLQRNGLVNTPELSTGTGRSHSVHNKRSRKALQKRRVCVSAVGSGSSSSPGSRGSMGESYLPHDMWAWRKYGQKPIKGSPHPRGYYRCSSSKGCPARKQVERSQTEPNMLLITYTSEHNHPFPTHRNALAGSTRHNLHPPSNNAAAVAPVAEDQLVHAEANREVQISPNNNSLQVEKEMANQCSDSVQLAAEEIYEESVELQNYLLSELQDFDEGMSLYSHNSNIMEAFIDHRSDYEEDEAVLMEGIAPIDPYNLFEWSSSPHLS